MLHVAVRGRVQGVGFRWFVRERARELGLSGWVKNLGDGSVEVAAVGAQEALEDLREMLLAGPPGASVAAVEVLDGVPATPIASGFTILR